MMKQNIIFYYKDRNKKIYDYINKKKKNIIFSVNQTHAKKNILIYHKFI